MPPTDVAAGQFSGTRIYSYSLPRYFAIFLNPENNKALADANVRAALAYATDKAEILKTALNNEGAAVDSPLPQNIYGLVAPDTVYGYDPQRAGKILDDAGYKIGTDGLRTKTIDRQPAFQFTKNLAKGSGPVTDVKELQKCLKREVAPDLDTNGNFGDKTLEAVKLFQEKYRADILDPQNIAQANGIVKQATRDKLNEVCFPSGDQTQALNIVLTVAGQPPFAGVAEIIKAQWAKIGVNVAIKTMDIGAFEQDAIKPRAYEAILFGEALGMIPDPYPFWHSSQKADPGLNFSLYENKDADKLLEEIRQTADQNARNEKLAAFQNLVARDEPAIFLYNPAYIYAVSDNVKGIQTHTISNPSQRFDGIADWYTATKRVWK